MSVVNKETVRNWLAAMIEAMPHGGRTRVAAMLGISPSGLSKLLNSPERGFDEKTIRCLAWINTSKAERFPYDKYPVIRMHKIGGLILETRNSANGTPDQEFVTWKKEE